MSEKEYIVTLTSDADAASFAAEMTQSTGDGNIPTRSVDVVNARPGSKRNTHYALSAEEVETLKNDPRVLDVEQPPSQIEGVFKGRSATQVGNFDKVDTTANDFVNWGLYRCSRTTSEYDPLTGYTNGASSDYEYNLDGTGVDIVIQDSGVEPNHPEWQDANGVSRYQSIDWAAASGLSFTQNTNHDRDYDGHGTHVAGIAAAKTYGWAKNARIYSQKIDGLEGTGDEGTGISDTYSFDSITAWHNAKPVDPVTGYKRPTIVNMSWGFYAYNTYEPYDGYYRGEFWTYNNNNPSAPNNFTDSSDMYTHANLPLWNNSYNGDPARQLPKRYTSVDTDVEEMIAAGIHVCVAAGNQNLNVSLDGDPDYNNRYRVNPFGTPGGYIYYNRGSSPFSPNAFIVGNADKEIDILATNLEVRASSSNIGPGVNIFAPGYHIMSTMSTVNTFAELDYPADTNYKIDNVSGTSMASPQVAGVAALVCQANPHITPAQLKSFLENQAQTGMLKDDPNYSSWTISTSNYSANIVGGRYTQGSNRYLYSPYPGQYKFRIQNP